MFTTTRRPRAYTLIELLIVIVILGIAGMMVIPNFSSTDVLRVQGAIRTIVSDVGIAQSDAIALQRGRAIVFHTDAANPYYAIVEVNGSNVDESLDTLERRELGGTVFGFTSIESINLPNNMIIFDELGGPVTAPGSGVPANDGYVDIAGSGQRFRVHIEGYTGRVTVERLADAGGS